MSFTSLGTGGKYKHQHGYSLLFHEFYGTMSNPMLGKWDINNKATWTSPQKSSSQNNVTHTAYTSQSTSAINQYYINADTTYTEGFEGMPPFISVYFWRRTA
mgnify:CR=1 FL=1